MKNLKYISALCVMLCFSIFSFAQETIDNGRPAHVVPGQAVVEASNTNPATNANTNSDEFSDQDVPGEQRPDQGDTYYPEDFDFMQDELQATTHPAEIAEKINELNDLIGEMRRMTEELRLENQIIRESLGNCCSSSALGLSASDAYLIQNAPNPYTESTEIKYFIPGGLENVELRITDIKGELISSNEITESGYGKVQLNADRFGTGSFVYMLAVKGEVVDSKVMIITQ